MNHSLASRATDVCTLLCIRIYIIYNTRETEEKKTDDRQIIDREKKRERRERHTQSPRAQQLALRSASVVPSMRECESPPPLPLPPPHRRRCCCCYERVKRAALCIYYIEVARAQSRRRAAVVCAPREPIPSHVESPKRLTGRLEPSRHDDPRPSTPGF